MQLEIALIEEFRVSFQHKTGADPGFPIGGGANPPGGGGGAPTYDFAKFCEKLHEIEKILARAGFAPPKSATARSSYPEIGDANFMYALCTFEQQLALKMRARCRIYIVLL